VQRLSMPYAAGSAGAIMGVMAGGRAELLELINSLPDEQVPFVTADVRRRLQPAPTSTETPFAWVGSITNGPVDASSPERIDQMLARGFGRD
jgi:hypothetical protein